MQVPKQKCIKEIAGNKYGGRKEEQAGSLMMRLKLIRESVLILSFGLLASLFVFGFPCLQKLVEFTEVCLSVRPSIICL
jgi:hypothetical protein